MTSYRIEEEIPSRYSKDARYWQGMCSIPKKDENLFPPDSKYAVPVMIGSFIANAYAYGLLNSFGVLVIPLSDDFRVGRGKISWIGSLAFGMALLFSFISGLSCESVGFGLLVFIGGMLIAMGLLLSSVVGSFWHLYITYGILIGVGISFVIVPAIGSVGQWFQKYRGLMLGISASGAAVGTIAIPPLLTFFIDSFGWRSSLQLIAIPVILLLFSSLLLRQRLPSQPGRLSSLLNALKTRNMISFLLISIFASFSFAVPYVHIVAYAEDKGVNSQASAILISILGACSAVGRILWGMTSDKIGSSFGLRVCFFGLTVITFIWGFFSPYWVLVIFSILFGLFSGGYTAILPIAIAEHFGPQMLPSLIGVMYPVSVVGQTVGPPIVGAIFDATGSYFYGILFASFAFGMSFLMTMFIPKPRDSWGGELPKFPLHMDEMETGSPIGVELMEIKPKEEEGSSAI